MRRSGTSSRLRPDDRAAEQREGITLAVSQLGRRAGDRGKLLFVQQRGIDAMRRNSEILLLVDPGADLRCRQSLARGKHRAPDNPASRQLPACQAMPLHIHNFLPFRAHRTFETMRSGQKMFKIIFCAVTGLC